ncbi:MAG: hypothetical protein WAZ98_14210 [Cyclobacteriaceae bacterium]
MKKCSFLFLAFVLPAVLFAQDDKTPKRPENMGVSDFDTFKNNSFDILDESAKLKTDATRLDTDVKSYAAGLASVSVEKLKADFKAFRGIGKSTNELTGRIEDLREQSKALLESAKSLKPMTKSPQATGNTNKSVKGLDASKKNLDTVATLVTDNTKLLSEELKRRGESVEEE